MGQEVETESLYYPLQSLTHSSSLEVDVDGEPAFPEPTLFKANAWTSERIPEVAEKWTNFLVEKLVQLEPFQRIEGVKQVTSMSLTSLAHQFVEGVIHHFFNHNRLEHSIDVKDEAIDAAKIIGLTSYQTIVAAIVGLSHDLGHPAFAHSGEEVIQVLGFPEFDHDLYTIVLVSQPEIQGLVEKFGIDHKDVIACLAGPKLLEADVQDRLSAMQEKLKGHGLPWEIGLDASNTEDFDRVRRWSTLHVLVQDVLDSKAYTRMDWERSTAATERKEGVAANLKRFAETLSINEDGVLTLSAVSPFKTFLLDLGDFYQKYSCSFNAAIAKQAIIAALLGSEINPLDLISSNDQNILGRLDDRYKRWFKDGVDVCFDPLFNGNAVSVPIDSSIDADNVASVIKGAITELKASKEIPDDLQILVGATPPFNKKFVFALTDEARVDADRVIEKNHSLIMNNSKYHDQFSLTLSRSESDLFTLRCRGTQSVVLAVETAGMNGYSDEQTDRFKALIEAKVAGILSSLDSSSPLELRPAA